MFFKNKEINKYIIYHTSHKTEGCSWPCPSAEQVLKSGTVPTLHSDRDRESAGHPTISVEKKDVESVLQNKNIHCVYTYRTILDNLPWLSEGSGQEKECRPHPTPQIQHGCKEQSR